MRAALLLLLSLALAACKQEMAQQRRLDTYGPAPLWPDGSAARPLPAGGLSKASELSK